MSIRSRTIIPLEHTPKAEFVAFHFDGHTKEDLAIVFSALTGNNIPLVRLHSECLTGEVFGSLKCDCKAQLDEAMNRMSDEGGILLYLRQEGRGIGLYNKLDAYRLQNEGKDTFEANIHLGLPEDAREYKIAALMLRDLSVTRIRLLTNNPHKAKELEENGIEIAEIIPTISHSVPDNIRYLEAKRRHGHSL